MTGVTNTVRVELVNIATRNAVTARFVSAHNDTEQIPSGETDSLSADEQIPAFDGTGQYHRVGLR
jgi:hypothetical protein